MASLWKIFAFYVACTIERLHEELSAIKSKWRIIGESFNIPSESLDYFADLSDPLLEVIIHWVKAGRGGVPPSWDAVVAAVDEADLADKIYKLYCDHKEEQKVERKGQAYSGNFIEAPVSKYI